MINVAIMGHGVVGSGVAEILIHHSERITKAARTNVNVKYILDLRHFPDLSYSEKFITDFSMILNDNEVKIVAELMGGLHPAYDFVKACLEKGKSVVTSNKELIAVKGAELIKIAKANGANLFFEASVGGGIPVVLPLVQCFVANDITKIAGILNGTTNYILNKMIVDNMSFSDALALAQEKGYAEKDPTADIEGDDACRKLCILAALAYRKHVYPEQVKTEGISSITLDDIAYADTLGYVIKLIGLINKLDNGSISASVRPTLVSRENILSCVNGVNNAVMVTGDKVGDVMFYGEGAGKDATASAVVADILDCVKYLERRKYFSWKDSEPGFVDENVDEFNAKYIRIKANDFAKAEASYDEIFGIDELNVIKNEFAKEIVFVTKPDLTSNTLARLEKFKDAEIKVLNVL